MADTQQTPAGDSGSPQRVALELMQYIRDNDATQRIANTKQEIIDLYVDCLWATGFNRKGGK
jgi:hypothetical protein